MNNKVYDCAIIGGGLAVQLADSGRSVVLFEKEKYPFHKVCGEYISMESYSFLERLGIPLSSMNLPMINELKVSSPNGTSFIRKLDMGGFGISRFTLDALLAELSVKKGVLLLEETKVNNVSFKDNGFVLETTKGKYYSRITSGAYGKRSSLDNKHNAPALQSTSDKEKNYVAVKYHVKIDLPDNRIELHNFKNGYCGISKVDEDKYCMCYLTTAKNLSDSGNDIKKMEKEILMQNEFLKGYFTEAVRQLADKQPLTISQLTFKKKSAVKNHILLLGDAAGTIAPLCGNGMSMAMRASFVASLLINEFLNGNITREELFVLYEKRWNELFSKRIKIGYYIQHLFGRNYLTNMSIGLFKIFPSAADKLIRMTHGDIF